MDIPEEVWHEIKVWAKRKALDTKWHAYAELKEPLNSIYLRMIQSALEIGAAKGYEIAKKEDGHNNTVSDN